MSGKNRDIGKGNGKDHNTDPRTFVYVHKGALRQVCQVSPRANKQDAELSALVSEDVKATASTHARVLSTLSLEPFNNGPVY